ncbi:hypothetical protein RchiOBHm_Chr6g0253951 [Rosa chinensis]|uniref:Uncharacterized protein n=1 Tax=Rosa chinensis TaxID=74649 RepID=A0A2P6PLG4_ROSCH|nr:hypothetical protein RchiOBHm_Chr6g0253951 [Rosa chinensis]
MFMCFSILVQCCFRSKLCTKFEKNCKICWSNVIIEHSQAILNSLYSFLLGLD